MISLQPLSPEYAPFTPEDLLCCLEGQDPLGKKDAILIGFGIEQDGTPAGVVLGRISPDTQSGKIFHLPEVGLEQSLQAMMEAFHTHNCRWATILFEENTTTTNALIEAGWSQPQLIMIHYIYDVDQFHPDWWGTPPPMPKDYTMIPWTELPNEALKELKQQDSPDDVSPFRHADSPIEPINSLALLHNGQIIGWMLTHRVDSATIRYTALHIRQEHQSQGLAFALLYKAIHRHKTSPKPRPLALFTHNIQQVSPFWSTFLEKRLAPHANEKRSFYDSSIIIESIL